MSTKMIGEQRNGRKARAARGIVGALGLWLGVLDTLTHRARLHGLSWGENWTGPLLALVMATRRPAPLVLLATLPLALLLQLALATARRHGLNPKRALAPGSYSDRTITQIEVAGAHGPVPALHIVPREGASTAVAVAHGSGCDKTFYAWRLVDALVGQGMAVLLVDLDGHGESPRPQAFPEIVESVAGPTRWLRLHYKRVGLLGMSLGGAVAARAVAEGAPCDALVLWAVPPQLRLNEAEYRSVRRAETLGIARPTLVHLFEDGSIYHISRAWQTSGIRASIGTWDLFDALDLLGSLERVKAQPVRPPLLLIYAGRDAVLRAGADRAVEAATADWGEFHRIAGASHVSLPIEPATIAISVEWLATQLAERSEQNT